MNIAPGVRLGPYEVVSPLGAGGMGEVFRARDPRLSREVAIKVLPAALSNDPERLRRFEREAQLLAQLHHSNVASVFGLEESDGVRALVMELVEGPTLEERLQAGPLPVEEALSAALQIAEALEEAHEKGIVHRDLKPANVKVTADGKVKVLDFGLAKALSVDAGPGSASQLAQSPTLTEGATGLGVILGTAGYMSPEQAKGKPVDRRADVWAFGVVLWEMLTGRKLFEGETVAETLAAVLRADPDWTLLPAGLPAPVADVLRRCLERDPRRRLHDVADARIVLEDLLSGRGASPRAVAPASAPAPAPARRWAGRAAVFLLGALATLAVLRPARRAPAPEATALQPTAFRQLTFLAGGESAPALSRDGESFAYVKEVGGQSDVFLQRVGGSNAVNLTAGCAEDDDEPAFSPDGKRIAYRSECSGGGIFVMGATGESARKITDRGYNPAWSPDGLELAVADEQLHSPFGRGTTSRLWAVRIETGERRLLSGRDAMQPSWSPDGRRVAFWGLEEASSARDLFTVAADGSQSAQGAAVRLVDDPPVDWSPVWSPDGRSLLFSSTRGGTMNVWRIAVDGATGRPLGAPQPVTVPSSWAGFLSASSDGRRLAFLDRNARTAVRVASFDPSAGAITGTPRAVPLGTLEVHESVALSPDGGTLLFDDAGLPQHLFLADSGGGLRQLTEGLHRDRQGAFSPDGAWIAFQTSRWPSKLALIRPDGSGLHGLPTGRKLGAWNPVWSPDGQWLAASGTDGPFRLQIADGRAVGPAEPLAPVGEGGLAFWPFSFSPDGRRLAGILQSPANTPVGAAIYGLADRSYRRVRADGVTQLLFLPDGRRVVAVTPRALTILDVEGGGARTLVTASEGWRMVRAALAGDGRHLAWHERADESDVWLAELEVRP